MDGLAYLYAYLILVYLFAHNNAYNKCPLPKEIHTEMISEIDLSNSHE